MFITRKRIANRLAISYQSHLLILKSNLWIKTAKYFEKCRCEDLMLDGFWTTGSKTSDLRRHIGL